MEYQYGSGGYKCIKCELNPTCILVWLGDQRSSHKEHLNKLTMKEIFVCRSKKKNAIKKKIYIHILYISASGVPWWPVMPTLVERQGVGLIMDMGDMEGGRVP